MKCRNCGTEVSDSDKFCPVCGEAIVVEERVAENNNIGIQSYPQMQIKGFKKKYAILMIVASAVLVLFMFIRFITNLSMIEDYIVVLERGVFEQQQVALIGVLSIFVTLIAFCVSIFVLVFSIISASKKTAKFSTILLVFGIVLTVLTAIYLVMEIMALAYTIRFSDMYGGVEIAGVVTEMMPAFILDVSFVVLSIMVIVGSRKLAN